MPILRLSEYVQMIEPEEDGSLTLEVLDFIANLKPLGDSDVKVIAHLESGEIAKSIVEEKEDWKRKSLSIASALLRSLKENGYKVEERKTSMQDFPPEITVKQEQKLEDMRIKELIALCAQDDPRKREAFMLISKNPDFIKARKRSPLAWYKDGKFQLERTLSYYELMCDPYANRQVPDKDKGERLINLAEAFGIETRLVRNPLTGQPERGPDIWGFDWIELLNEDIYKAALWALDDPKCKLHPRSSLQSAKNLKNFKEEWPIILRNYWFEKDRGNPYATNVKMYIDPPSDLAGEKKVNFLVDLIEEMIEGAEKNVIQDDRDSSRVDETYYRKMLYSVARPDKKISGTDKTIQKGVYKSLRVSGTDCYLDNVISLDGIKISGCDIHGTVILPPKQDIVETGLDIKVNCIYCRSWQEVAFKAGLLS